MNFEHHFARLKAATTSQYGLNNISQYIQDNVKLNGKAYSFENFEFQKRILNDTAPVSLTVKIAQVGLSTLSYAHALACCAVNPHWGYGYVFPTDTDAAKACQTRIDPMIAESPEIRRIVNSQVDSTELKQIGSSFLYFRGCRGNTAALSISLDFLTIDEYDRCDPLKAAQYVSRLQGKATKMQRIFSTPTVEGFGISLLAETAKRYRQIATCGKCNHTWLPSYHKDVKIPGWDKPLNEINKINIKDIDWVNASWLCPRCGRNPRFHFERLEWVCENLQDNYEANAWFVSPVTGHKVVPAPYLVNVSTKFGTYDEFQNQALGEPVSVNNENVGTSEIQRLTVKGDFKDSSVHYFGADMGLICHVTILQIGPDGSLIAVRREKVPLGKFEERRRELMSEYRCINSVHDTQPYVDLIQRLTEADPNAYGAMFTTTKTSEPYTVVQKEENREAGKLNIRRVNLNRTSIFDGLMHLIKTGMILFQDQGPEFESQFQLQMVSLKRLKVYDRHEDITYQWLKGDGNDHFHFSLLYAYVAYLVRGTATGIGIGSLPLVRTFRPRQNVSNIAIPQRFS
jgi:hypothetical protein